MTSSLLRSPPRDSRNKKDYERKDLLRDRASEEHERSDVDKILIVLACADLEGQLFIAYVVGYLRGIEELALFSVVLRVLSRGSVCCRAAQNLNYRRARGPTINRKLPYPYYRYSGNSDFNTPLRSCSNYFHRNFGREKYARSL